MQVYRLQRSRSVVGSNQVTARPVPFVPCHWFPYPTASFVFANDRNDGPNEELNRPQAMSVSVLSLHICLRTWVGGSQ